VAYQELDDVVAVLEPGAVERVPRFLVEEIGPEHDRYTQRERERERGRRERDVSRRCGGSGVEVVGLVEEIEGPPRLCGFILLTSQLWATSARYRIRY
jgi:hypothetical protein